MPVSEEMKMEVKDDAAYPEIPLPEGYAPSDEAGPDDEVSVLCKIKMKGPRRACIVSMDGAPYKAKEEAKEEVTEEVQSTDGASAEPGDFMGRMKAVRTKMRGY